MSNWAPSILHYYQRPVANFEVKHALRSTGVKWRQQSLQSSLHKKKLAETHFPNMHETVDSKVHLAVSYTGSLPVKEFKTTKPFAKTLQQVPILKQSMAETLWKDARCFTIIPVASATQFDNRIHIPTKLVNLTKELQNLMQYIQEIKKKQIPTKQQSSAAHPSV